MLWFFGKGASFEGNGPGFEDGAIDSAAAGAFDRHQVTRLDGPGFCHVLVLEGKYHIGGPVVSSHLDIDRGIGSFRGGHFARHFDDLFGVFEIGCFAVLHKLSDKGVGLYVKGSFTVLGITESIRGDIPVDPGSGQEKEKASKDNFFPGFVKHVLFRLLGQQMRNQKYNV